MARELPRIRHTAETPYGVFRTDFRNGKTYPYAVVYCGWVGLQAATRRRVQEREGLCYGWAENFECAKDLSDKAVQEGCVNVIIADVKVRELPA